MIKKPVLVVSVALGCMAWLTLLVQGQTPAQTNNAAGKKPVVESAPMYSEARYQPTNRVDPFLNPLLLRRNDNGDEAAPLGTPPPGIAGMNMGDVELLGTSIGPEEKRAAFRGTDKLVYFLREGDRLFDGYIKTIRPESVLLIRETKMRSGKVLTQEITKRLRT